MKAVTTIIALALTTLATTLVIPINAWEYDDRVGCWEDFDFDSDMDSKACPGVTVPMRMLCETGVVRNTIEVTMNTHFYNFVDFKVLTLKGKPVANATKPVCAGDHGTNASGLKIITYQNYAFNQSALPEQFMVKYSVSPFMSNDVLHFCQYYKNYGKDRVDRDWDYLGQPNVSCEKQPNMSDD
jgi:hypothetical protein